MVSDENPLTRKVHSLLAAWAGQHSERLRGNRSPVEAEDAIAAAGHVNSEAHHRPPILGKEPAP
jgi:hypothetical protein